MEERLKRLKTALNLEWGELASKLGISRSMLDQTRKGVREFGPQIMRALLAAEVEAGIREPMPKGMLSEDSAKYGTPEKLVYRDLDGRTDPADELRTLREYMFREFGQMAEVLKEISKDIADLKKRMKP